MLVLRGVAQPCWLWLFSCDAHVITRFADAPRFTLAEHAPMTVSNSPLPPVRPRPAVGGTLLASLAVGFAAACLAFWLSLAILPPSGLSTFSAWALGPTLVMAGVSTWVWCHRLTQAQRQAMRYFDELSRRDSQGSEGGAAAGGLNLPRSNPWHGLASRFAESFGVLSEQMGEIEQVRAAFEIRLRRDAARQRQTDSILANLSEPLVAINAFDEVVLINDAARRLFDLDEESTIGQPVSRALRSERLAGLLLDARRRGSPAQRTAEIEWTDEIGASRWFGAVARSLPADDRHGADDRRSLGAFVVLRDIAEIKTGQKRYAEFVSAVSHEMKSPLSGIKAYVELLADCDAADSTAREEFLGVIDSQANRLQRLIDNLLNIARIEAGVVEVSKDSISLHELLTEALEIVRPSAEAKSIRLSAEFSPMYLGVLADRDMLMQVAINLLSNAIKYTPEGGSVVLRTRMTDDEVEFEVIDTGVGLDEEDQLKVFEKFYRVKKDRGMAQGTGLGLPLAKHIVEDVHGGRIAVESTTGAGSVFRVSLPAAAQLVNG
jgi:two-component system phosphate regulon sensor histidine kinase PhoR